MNECQWYACHQHITSEWQTDRHHLTARTVLFICMHQQGKNLQNWFVQFSTWHYLRTTYRKVSPMYRTASWVLTRDKITSPLCVSCLYRRRLTCSILQQSSVHGRNTTSSRSPGYRSRPWWTQCGRGNAATTCQTTLCSSVDCRRSCYKHRHKL